MDQDVLKGRFLPACCCCVWEMLKHIGQFTYFSVLLKLDENVLSYTKADEKIVMPSVENRECALCRLVNRC